MPGKSRGRPAANFSHADASAADPAYRWGVLWVVMIGMVMAVLDGSIVNVSLPRMMADFGSNVDDIEWVVTGYMLAFATLMPLTGWLRNAIGHKRLYILSLTVFTCGSLLCGMAWNLPSLIAARVFQALGGGAIGPTSMSMISEVFPPKERGKAIGFWGMGIVVGPAVGPTLGGWLTNHFGWRSIFLVNLPVGILGVLMATAMLHGDVPEKSARRPFDFWGFGFLSIFLVSFLLAVSKGESDGWTSTIIVGEFLLAGLSFAAFLLVESLTTDQVVDLSLFENPVFSAAMIVSAVRSVALFGGLFLLPLFVQRIMGYDEIASGLLMFPGAIMLGIFMPIGGWLGDRVGPRWPALVGLAGVGAFMFLYRRLDVNTSVWGVIAPTMIRGISMPLLMAPIIAAAMNSIPREKTAMGSSILNVTQQVGGSIGIGVLTTVLQNRTHAHLGAMGTQIQSVTPAFREASVAVMRRALELGYGHAAAARVAGTAVAMNVSRGASVAGFEDAFLFGGGLIVVAMAAAFLLPAGPVHQAVLMDASEASGLAD
jgi:EmrB/QacA subfamily drug resistance transporter